MIKQLTAVLAVILVSIPSAIAFGQITGFVPTSYRELSAKASLELYSTAVYEMKIDIPAHARLASVRMSGEVIGGGRANAYLEDDIGKWHVVFSYNNKRNSFSRAITGMFDKMGSVLSGDDAHVLEFSGKCVETCYLEDNFRSGSLILVFDVEEGTILKVREITYNYDTFSETGADVSFKIGKLFSSLVHLFD
jgi:hypothetical protein